MSFNLYVKETVIIIMWLTGLWDRGRSVFGILQFILKALVYIHMLRMVLHHFAFSNRFASLSFFHSNKHQGRSLGCLSMKKNDHFPISFVYVTAGGSGFNLARQCRILN